MTDIFETQPQGEAHLLPDGRVILLQEPLPAGLAKLRVLSAGVAAGEMVKGRFEPAHALFLASHGGVFKSVLSFSAESEELAAFLAGEEIPVAESVRGYCAVAVGEHPLGFGKASGGALKNRLPKGLRMT